MAASLVPYSSPVASLLSSWSRAAWRARSLDELGCVGEGLVEFDSCVDDVGLVVADPLLDLREAGVESGHQVRDAADDPEAPGLSADRREWLGGHRVAFDREGDLGRAFVRERRDLGRVDADARVGGDFALVRITENPHFRSPNVPRRSSGVEGLI